MGFTVSMMLGSFAEVQEAGLTVLSGGWTVRGPEPEGPAALGVLIAVPRKYSGKGIDVRITLLDHATDEQIPIVPLDDDQKELGEAGPIQIEGELRVQGTDDPRVTIPLMASLAITLPPFRLPSGREFRWQLYLDEETRPEWAVHFRTTPPEPEPQH